jgi:tetratricopeptide (TPR) repeat protein/transglutaminase-like putative cysteine protease
MNRTRAIWAVALTLAASCGLVWAAQQPTKTPAKPPAAVSASEKKVEPDFSQEAFVIEKFRTTVKFENDGTGTRELLVRARVQNEAGVQQLGQLELGYNSASEKLEVDYVRVHKADGTVITAGPEAVQDLSAPVEREAPVYTDFRQKHVTVPGLRPGETLEYKITTRIHTALAAGHFWLEYNFIDRMIVLEESLSVQVPGERVVKVKTRPEHKPVTRDTGGLRTYLWTGKNLTRPDDDEEEKKPRRRDPEQPAVQLTTFRSWEEVGQWYAGLERERVAPNDALRAKAAEMTRGRATESEKVEALYDYVAKNFRYVSLSFGLGRYQPHSAADVLANQYGDCKDKHTLLASLLDAAGIEAYPVLINSRRKIDPDVPSPSQFDHVITAVHSPAGLQWMDTTTEVAPYRMLSGSLRKKQALLAPRAGTQGGLPRLVETPADPPFASSQLVEITGKVSELGKLDAKVKYTLRGDNELPLRIAFRRTPQAQWKQLAQMISSSDGVSGQVQDIKGSDPADTRQPFTLEMQVVQANFLDWSKKRSQVALPVPGMGLPAADDDAEEGDEPVELGSPVDVTMRVQLEFPQKFAARAPVPVAVSRDYADYRSTYKVAGQSFTLERLLRFKLRELPATRSRDYLAFARAIRADEAQSIGIESTVAGTPTIPETAKADELFQAALAALRNENPAIAIDLLKRTVELEPKHKQGWNALGYAYFAALNFEAAIGAFQRQIELNPYDENAYRNMGLVYQRQQKHAEAVEALKKQLEVKPLDRGAQSMLGIVYREWKKYPEAAHELEKAVVLDPENAGLHVNLGQAYLNLKEPDKAVAAFDKAVEIDASPTIWNNVAYELSLHKAHLDRALQYAESAVAATAAELRNVQLASVSMNDMRKVSSLASYWDTLGWVHFQRGDLDKAEKYCLASWMLDFHGEVGYHLGRIREKRGDKAGALNYYQMALEVARPFAESGGPVKTLSADAAVAAQARAVRRTVPELQTIKLGAFVNEAVTAEVLLIMEPDAQGEMKVGDVRFVKGSEKLRGHMPALRGARYPMSFPDAAPTKLVRRGMLSCSAGAGCLFVLLAADAVTSVD